jgi:hypothetical protein
MQCSIHEPSLRFSRFIYGLLVLIAYLLQSEWLILIVSILTILSAISLKLNVSYHLHLQTKKSLEKEKLELTHKDFGELSFVSAMTGIMLLAGFLLLHYTPYTTLAWTYILIVAAMVFLACFVGFCVATLMYVFLKNKFSHK